MRSLLSAVAVACLLMLPTMLPAFEPAEAELPALTKLVIVAGPAELTGALPDLPPDAKAIAANFADATAVTDRQTLVVGIKSDQPDGKELARLRFVSDCPTNSVFQSQEQLTAIPVDSVRKALTTWTRLRHNAERAPVQEIVDFEVYNGHRFDVRLDLRSVSVR